MSCLKRLASAGKNPRRSTPSFDPELVKKKKQEIIDFLSQNSSEIDTGQLVVFFVDECHLLGDDVCGYVWGQTNIRIEIPIKNTKDRQTYFGALDYRNQEFIVREYPAGNSSTTVEFIKYLQFQRPEKRIALIWDGVKYHRSDEIKDFLASVNNDCEPERWLITCILFAPNARKQNPVEDI